jgi:hypothetical protein
MKIDIIGKISTRNSACCQIELKGGMYHSLLCTLCPGKKIHKQGLGKKGLRQQQIWRRIK